MKLTPKQHAQASAAPEQEAVEPVVIEVHNGCVYMISKPLEPGQHKLYTHSDQSEVDRLRAENAALRKTLPNSTSELVDARQQLAEAHALLRDMADCPWVVEEATIPKAGVDAAPNQVVGTMHVSLTRLRKIRALLSATAQHAEVKS